MTIQQRQYWVIGGEFQSVDCAAMVPGTGQVLGPFPSYQHALEVWRRHAQESRFQATTRFSIVADAPRPGR